MRLKDECPHVQGGELVCYFERIPLNPDEVEPTVFQDNRNVLICSMCGGRFELQPPKESVK